MADPTKQASHTERAPSRGHEQLPPSLSAGLDLAGFAGVAGIGGLPAVATAPEVDPRVLVGLQRLAGNGAVFDLVTQRQLATIANRSAVGPVVSRELETTTVTVDDTLMETNGDVAAFYTSHIEALLEQRADLAAGGVAAPESLTNAITNGQDYAAVCRREPARKVDIGLADEVRFWFNKHYVKGNNAAEAARGEKAAADMKKTIDTATKAQAALEGALDSLRDAQRTQFKGRNEEGLDATADLVATVVDTLLVLKDGLIAITSTQRDVLNEAGEVLMKAGIARSFNANQWVTRLAEGLNTLNNIYSALQLVRAGFDVLSAKETGTGKAKAGIAGMATTISAGGTLLGASAGFTVYANLYIGPMVSMILAGISKIEDLFSRIENRRHIENGDFHLVNWDIEPGGRVVFDFMLAVMRAGDSTGVPKPVPADVSSYFVDKEDELSAGVSGEALPTTGWLFEDVDEKKISYWVFRNRANLWGMLYGAAKPPP